MSKSVFETVLDSVSVTDPNYVGSLCNAFFGLGPKKRMGFVCDLCNEEDRQGPMLIATAIAVDERLTVREFSALLDTGLMHEAMVKERLEGTLENDGVGFDDIRIVRIQQKLIALADPLEDIEEEPDESDEPEVKRLKVESQEK